MRLSLLSAFRFGSAFLTLLMPLAIAGCGGGGSSTPTQTVRGIVLLDTGTGATDSDPLAGLVPVTQTEIYVTYYNNPSPAPFADAPYAKTNAQGRFTLNPKRGSDSFELRILNRCSTTAAINVNSSGNVGVVPSSINNVNGANPPLQQRASTALTALRASADTSNIDVAIIVSDQQDACSQ